MQPADFRNRPVVLESGSTDRPPRRRRPWPRTVFGLGTAGFLAAAGVVAGSWSIMSAVGTTTPPGNNAPLWFSPPAPVNTTQGPPAPSIKDTPKPGSNPGSGSGSHSGSGSGSGSSSSVETEHRHESGSVSPTAHHPVASSAQTSVPPPDDHGRKGPPPSGEDTERGRGGDGS